MNRKKMKIVSVVLSTLVIATLVVVGLAGRPQAPPSCPTTTDGCKFAAFGYAESWVRWEDAVAPACQQARATCSVVNGTFGQCYVVRHGSGTFPDWVSVKVCCDKGPSCGTVGSGGPCDGVQCTPDGIYIEGSNEYTCCISPIVIDTTGNGFDFTNAGDGVNFDLNNDGIKERIAWTEADSMVGFLVLDRNGNRRADNGAELFGNFTDQPSSPTPNGFLALAQYDSNSDGAIDSQDSIFNSLRIWIDSDHDGINEPDEIFTLQHFGITRISLDYKLSARRDQFGNGFRYRAKIEGDRVGRWAYDVFFAKQ